MGLETLVIERISAAALFHDIGKSRIDSRIWSKPTLLDPDEFELVKMHPVLGAEMMRVCAPLDEIISGIELHHEALDGSGYPYGLRDSQIPVTARVTTVADAFDAMTSMRTYQAPIAAEAALNTLRHLAGAKFDVSAVSALCDVMGGCADQGPSGPGGLFADLIVRTA
jgi:HD-GYP domain-containing protein (c-di-GMP phosphodiesterase class II)